MRYPVQPRGRIFGKGYEFLSFAKNIGKSIGKKISKTLTARYCPGMSAMRQKPLGHAKKSATHVYKTLLKRVFQKTKEATGGLIGNKTADRITKMSRN